MIGSCIDDKNGLVFFTGMADSITRIFNIKTGQLLIEIFSLYSIDTN